MLYIDFQYFSNIEPDIWHVKIYLLYIQSLSLSHPKKNAVKEEGADMTN